VCESVGGREKKEYRLARKTVYIGWLERECMRMWEGDGGRHKREVYRECVRGREGEREEEKDGGRERER
jgi:hypothetical protein